MSPCTDPAALVLPLVLFLLGGWLIVRSVRAGRLTWSYVPKGKKLWQRRPWHLHHRRRPIRFRLQLAALVLVWVGALWLLAINAVERCSGS